MGNIKEHFISHEARLWPPDDEKPPYLENDPVQVMWDESALIYSTKSSETPEMQDIILIGFDPAIKCKGLVR